MLMFDRFLSFHGIRLNAFASLLLNQESHVTNITVLIVVYIGDLFSMLLLCGNILHHNHVFIPIVHQNFGSQLWFHIFCASTEWQPDFQEKC